MATSAGLTLTAATNVPERFIFIVYLMNITSEGTAAAALMPVQISKIPYQCVRFRRLIKPSNSRIHPDCYTWSYLITVSSEQQSFVGTKKYWLDWRNPSWRITINTETEDAARSFKTVSGNLGSRAHPSTKLLIQIHFGKHALTRTQDGYSRTHTNLPCSEQSSAPIMPLVCQHLGGRGEIISRSSETHLLSPLMSRPLPVCTLRGQAVLRLHVFTHLFCWFYFYFPSLKHTHTHLNGLSFLLPPVSHFLSQPQSFLCGIKAACCSGVWIPQL